MSEPPATPAPASARSCDLRSHHDRYLDAVRAGDRRAALTAVEEAHEAGASLHELYLDVFQPVLREIGRLWQENVLSVAEEHLATAITQAAMVHLYGGHELPEPGQRSLLAACAESERHEIGLRMVCDFLDFEGWDTRFLGASVPLPDLVRMVGDRRPDVVALSASIPPHLTQVRRTIDAIREDLGPDAPFILVGGRPFLEAPELAARLGADLVATDAAEAATALRERFG